MNIIHDIYIQQAAPKSLKPADWFDWFQENPYEITERLPGKIWSVKYHVENSGAFRCVCVLVCEERRARKRGRGIRYQKRNTKR